MTTKKGEGCSCHEDAWRLLGSVWRRGHDEDLWRERYRQFFSLRPFYLKADMRSTNVFALDSSALDPFQYSRTHIVFPSFSHRFHIAPHIATILLQHGSQLLSHRFHIVFAVSLFSHCSHIAFPSLSHCSQCAFEPTPSPP